MFKKNVKRHIALSVIGLISLPFVGGIQAAGVFGKPEKDFFVVDIPLDTNKRAGVGRDQKDEDLIVCQKKIARLREDFEELKKDLQEKNELLKKECVEEGSYRPALERIQKLEKEVKEQQELAKRVEDIENWREGIKTEMQEVKKNIEDLKEELGQKIGLLNKKMDEQTKALQQEMGGLKEEMNENMAKQTKALQQEMNENMAKQTKALQQAMGGVREEMDGLLGERFEQQKIERENERQQQVKALDKLLREALQPNNRGSSDKLALSMGGAAVLLSLVGLFFGLKK